MRFQIQGIRLILGFALFALLPFSPSQSFANFGACEDVFSVSSSDSQRQIARLPDHVLLPTSATEVRSLALLANHLFSTGFPAETVLQRSEKIQLGFASEFSRKEYKQLKEARKLGQVIRSSYYLFSAEHVPPVEFDELMRDFGKMIDRAKNNNPVAVKFGKKVYRRMSERAWDLDRYPTPDCDVASFHREIDAMTREIQRLMNAPSINIDEYHDLRKKVRDFKILFDLMAQENPSKENRRVSEYFDFLNTELGDTKDDLKDEAKAAQGEYFTQVTVVQRTLIQSFLNRLSWGP